MQEDGQFLKCGLLVSTVCLGLYQYWGYQWIRRNGVSLIPIDGARKRKRFDIGSSDKILEIIGLEACDRFLFELRMSEFIFVFLD